MTQNIYLWSWYLIVRCDIKLKDMSPVPKKRPIMENIQKKELFIIYDEEQDILEGIRHKLKKKIQISRSWSNKTQTSQTKYFSKILMTGLLYHHFKPIL